MKKVSLKFIVDQLGELGWDYSCGRMSRSGMEIYDGIMRHVGVIKPYEHWNEDCYKDANGDWLSCKKNFTQFNSLAES